MLCIPIIASNTEEAINKMSVAGRLGDVLEVRLDLMDSFDIPGLIKAAEKPVLITYRSVREGGMGKEGPQAAADHLISAIESGADLVDVELSMPRNLRERILEVGGKTKIIVSTHVINGTPSVPELERLFRDSAAAGGDIVKIVTMARKWEDNFKVLNLLHKAGEDDVKMLAFCMGPLGRMSRVFSVLMGAYMTFASLEEGQESAKGQIPIDKMKELMEFFSE